MVAVTNNIFHGFVPFKKNLKSIWAQTKTAAAINGRHHYLSNRYGISVSQITTDMFHLLEPLTGPYLIHALSPVL